MSIIINDLYNSEDEIQENEIHDVSQMENIGEREGGGFNDIILPDNELQNTVIENENQNSDEGETETNEGASNDGVNGIIVSGPSRVRSNNETTYRTVDYLTLTSVKGDDIYIAIMVPGTPDPNPKADFTISGYSVDNRTGGALKMTTSCKVDYTDFGVKYKQNPFEYVVSFGGYGVKYGADNSHDLVSTSATFNMRIDYEETVYGEYDFDGLIGFAPTGYAVNTYPTEIDYDMRSITLEKPYLSIVFYNFRYVSGYQGYKMIAGNCKFYPSYNFDDAINASEGKIPVNALTVRITFSVMGSTQTVELKNKLSFNYTTSYQRVLCVGNMGEDCSLGVESMFNRISINTGGSSPDIEVSSVTVSIDQTYLKENKTVGCYGIAVDRL